MVEKQKVYASGKRKAAVAKAILSEGKGKITVNGQDYKNLEIFSRLKLEEPIRIAEHILGKANFDIVATARGGGEKGQIEAVRLSISKAIIQFTKSEELKKAYLDYDRNLLVADVRRKETRKPGDSKARAKRQTSYR
ncbi:30S ribosomal protein S9 [Candidatus Pacearchaeota archaeon CG10_big_fil_rev_8_21_14_0_10_32_42]|nr:MAG: 30S ribosomal protein S9 [Candidatus Pacearchaeota archaeon CG10_big_fil_rev_8_21_14_0_10_32_42]